MENNIDFKSIEAFQGISKASIEKLKQDAQLLKFKLGAPISRKGRISNKVLIIIRGEARFLHDNGNKLVTVSKLGINSFIGLASILNAKGIELVTAKTDSIVLAISDNLILNLYAHESSFKSWCDTQIFIQEIYELINNLLINTTTNDRDIIKFTENLSNNISLKLLNNNDRLNNDEGFLNFISSANVIDKSPGDIININERVLTRGPFPARIISIEKSKYNNLLNNPYSLDDTTNLFDKTISDIKYAPEIFDKTVNNVGQYEQKEKFKIIKANGIIKETLACLQMLAIELKLPYRVDSIEKILLDNIQKSNKPTLQLIGGITSTMGLHTTIAKGEANKAGRLPSNSLITWGKSFAIVKESNSKYLELVSPKEGLIYIKSENFEKTFESGYIECLVLEKHEQTPENKFGFQWILPVISRYKNVLIQVFLASFVVQLFGLANPLMIQVIIDKVISQRSLDTLQVLGFALVVVTILGGILSSLRTFLFAETTNRIDTRLGSEVIDHLLRLPLNYFDRRPVGELGTRVAELEKIRNFLTGQALTTILDAIFSVIYIIVMVIYSWLLTIIALGVVPIQIFITLIGTPLIRRQIRDIAHENATTQSHLVEVLTAIQTVKAQNVERVSRWKWQELYGKYIARSFDKTITGTALGETSQVLQQLSQLIVLWVGASLVLKGQLSLGQLIAFRIISGYVTQPLLRLSTIWQNIQELRVSFERLADIIDTPEESTDLDKAKIPLPPVKGSVEFEDLSFSFYPGQPQILKKVNLKVESGQFIGIVGQSGSGKSTLMKLLPRLYKPNSGRLLIDGYDIDKVELYSLRKQIGIVPQEPLLFKGSVSDNIALTDPEAPSDEIVKVSRIANSHDFIMNLPEGYSTNVGERGAGLSGGQKQRIAIARTLLSNPKILIMDEATSALDYETERKVCEGIRENCKNSTVFFITHRLSTVKNSDLIVMLHQGAIDEIGTHNELLNRRGRYYALYNQQESN